MSVRHSLVLRAAAVNPVGLGQAKMARLAGGGARCSEKTIAPRGFWARTAIPKDHQYRSLLAFGRGFLVSGAIMAVDERMEQLGHSCREGLGDRLAGTTRYFGRFNQSPSK